MAMLLTPAGGKGKNALQNNITDTPNNKKTPTETDTSNNKKNDENASVKPKNTTFDTENQNKKGEAYAEGGDAPIVSNKFNKEDYKKADDESLGDFGERVAEDYYRPQGYDEFYAVQNKSGNGVDVIGRNSQTGDMVKAEVKTTQQDRLWNDGNPKEIPLKGDQKTMGGENYTNDRLNRAANAEDGYTDGKSTEQAEKALEFQREALDKGATVKTEKLDIYVDKEGNLRTNPIPRNW